MHRDRHGNRLPDFLIVGAAKSGTTSLYHYMRQHPRIFMPDNKEPHYLSMAHDGTPAGRGEYGIGHYVRSYEDYVGLFRAAGDDVLAGEASVSYLPLSETTIARIKEVYRDHRRLRIIVILRDPCERAVSHHAMKVRDGKERKGLAEALSPEVIRQRMTSGYDITWDYLRLGLYAEDLRNYMRVFDNVLVVNYADFAADALQVLKRVFEFLGVDSTVPLALNGQHYNISGVARHAFLKPLVYLTYQDNPAKALLARVLPKAVKVRLQNRVGAMILRRVSPKEAVAERLRRFYAEDQRRVQELTRELLIRQSRAA
jgi:hypothetical protein